MQPNLSELDYWWDVQLVMKEVENAVAIFHTYEEINRTALEDRGVFAALDKDALFWNIQMYSLQTSLFMVMARIFDSDHDALSVHKLLNETLKHVEFFLKPALAARKREAGISDDEVEQFVKGAWYPTQAADLRYLKKALAPHAATFEQVYRPIRINIFAHRIATHPHSVAELFSRTNRNELGAILDFLHCLLRGIEGLYQNGIKPDFSEGPDTTYQQKVRDSVKSVLSRIAIADGHETR